MIRVALLALIACGLAGFGTIVWMVMPHNQDVAAAAAVPVDKVKVIIAAKALNPVPCSRTRTPRSARSTRTSCPRAILPQATITPPAVA